MTETAKNKSWKKPSRKTVAIVFGVVVLGLAGYGLYAAGIRAERQRVLRAEAARVGAILAKPLPAWTLAEREEFAGEYEARRARERADDPALWTKKEKRSEWWRYSKLVTRKTVDGWRHKDSSAD